MIENHVVSAGEVQLDMQSSIDEKDALLREIHHRVKNNLQVISSMLNLQSSYIEDPRISEVFQECQTRIKSMALIHETLYQSRNLAKVDFKSYLNKLVSRLGGTYVTKAGKAQLHCNAHDVSLPVDLALPCGLIVNELVSNALKHGFPDATRGKISVDFEAFLPQSYRLRVADTGIGLPEGFDINKEKTMGLQLVTVLSKQLDAELTVTSDNGSSFELVFSEKPKGF